MSSYSSSDPNSLAEPASPVSSSGVQAFSKEQHLRFLIDQMQETFIIYRVERDSSGKIFDWIVDDCNKAAAERLGLSYQDALGRSALQMFGPETLEPYLQICCRLEGTKNVEKFETYFEFDRRHYSSSVFFITNDLYVNVSEDITERKRNEQQRYELQQQLHQALKLEALGRLAGGIAHDFNNILQPILGHAELMLDSELAASELSEGVSVIRKAAIRAQELTKQILSFSRNDSSGASSCSVQTIIGEVHSMMRAVLPARIKLKTEVDPAVPEAAMSSSSIHRILVNLVTNASQALAESPGEIVVRLKMVEAGMNVMTSSGRFLLLEVEDDGPGIPEEDLEHIFDPFFTTKAEGEGTGLGLSVVHSTIIAAGGGIKADSSLGKGTSFRLQIPVAEQAMVRQSASKQAPPGKKRLMLVDDEPMIASVMSRLLTRCGHEVQSYGSSQEALEAFKKDAAAFDLIISDLSMPGLSGLDFALAIREVHPSIPIVIFSGNPGAIEEQSLDAARIQRVLTKPVLFAELLAVIDELTTELSEVDS